MTFTLFGNFKSSNKDLNIFFFCGLVTEQNLESGSSDSTERALCFLHGASDNRLVVWSRFFQAVLFYVSSQFDISLV